MISLKIFTVVVPSILALGPTLCVQTAVSWLLWYLSSQTQKDRLVYPKRTAEPMCKDILSLVKDFVME